MNNDYVFTKISLLKKDLYPKLKQLLVSAGWKNISSNTITDYDVFQSKGESGKQELYFQLKPYDTNDTGEFNTTDGTIMSFRFISKYTPGVSGVSGTFKRPSEAWRRIIIFHPVTTVSPNQTVDLYYHVNKNRIVFVLDINTASNAFGTTVLLGLPDNALTSEKDSRGLIFAAQVYRDSVGKNLVLASSSSHIDTATCINHTIYHNLAPISLNSLNKVMISDLAYGDVNEGVRGILDGLFIVKSGNFVHGDIILDGNKKYRIFYQPNPTSTTYGFALPSEHVLIRIE